MTEIIIAEFLFEDLLREGVTTVIVELDLGTFAHMILSIPVIVVIIATIINGQWPFRWSDKSVGIDVCQ